MSALVQPVGRIAHHLKKEEIIDLAEVNARASLRNQNYNPLRIYVELKRYEHYLGALINCMKPAAIREAEERGRSFALAGAEIALHYSRQFDYERDAQWRELNGAYQSARDARSERQEALKKGRTGVPVKSRKPVIKVKI